MINSMKVVVMDSTARTTRECAMKDLLLGPEPDGQRFRQLLQEAMQKAQSQ
jgi:hypothetical protein